MNLRKCSRSTRKGRAACRAADQELALGVDEPVARAGLGEEIARTRWVRLDLAAKLRDVDVQVVGLRSVRGPPDLAENCSMGEQLSGVDGQKSKSANSCGVSRSSSPSR